jgi:hypothetical protein
MKPRIPLKTHKKRSEIPPISFLYTTEATSPLIELTPGTPAEAEAMEAMFQAIQSTHGDTPDLTFSSPKGSARCNMIYPGSDGKIICCKEPAYIQLKVRVFHVASGIRRWQTWPFCKSHYLEFIGAKGEGYSYRKKKDRSLIAIAIEYLTSEGALMKIKQGEFENCRSFNND